MVAGFSEFGREVDLVAIRVMQKVAEQIAKRVLIVGIGLLCEPINRPDGEVGAVDIVLVTFPVAVITSLRDHDRRLDDFRKKLFSFADQFDRIIDRVGMIFVSLRIEESDRAFYRDPEFV